MTKLVLISLLFIIIHYCYCPQKRLPRHLTDIHSF